MLVLAVRITSLTAQFIAKLNDGVEPALPENEGKIFISGITGDVEFKQIVTIDEYLATYSHATPKMTVQVQIKR